MHYTSTQVAGFILETAAVIIPVTIATLIGTRWWRHRPAHGVVAELQAGREERHAWMQPRRSQLPPGYDEHSDMTQEIGLPEAEQPSEPWWRRWRDTRHAPDPAAPPRDWRNTLAMPVHRYDDTEGFDAIDVATRDFDEVSADEFIAELRDASADPPGLPPLPALDDPDWLAKSVARIEARMALTRDET
jgi:hypothetical protein